MIRLYIAGSFNERDRFRRYADILRAAGVEVTSSWLHEPPILHSDPEHVAWEKRARAHDDLADIARSDVLAVFTSWPSSSGGLYHEVEYASAHGKRVIIVGPLLNIFMYRQHFEHSDGLADLLDRTAPGPYEYAEADHEDLLAEEGSL